MKFIEYVNKYRSKINAAIGAIYNRKIEKVENSFLKDFYTELRDYFLAGGKRIRPLLCIAAYNAFCDDETEKIIGPSVGVEFLHNASLVHDDIIDKDDFRRGEPAFHYRFKRYHAKYDLKKMVAEDFGTNIGILGGDTAFFLGLEAYLFNEFDQKLNMKAIEYYEKVFTEVCDGVLIEIDMVNQKDLSTENYIEMVALKTGALIEKSLLIGAHYANADDDKKELLSTYGKSIGVIFQIIDDILGTFGDEKVTGKPTDGDIREGKKTCLLIGTMCDLDDDNKRCRLTELIEKPEMTDDEVDEVRSIFEHANAVKSANDLAQLFYNTAKEALDKLSDSINPSEAEFFQNLLDFVMTRKF